LAVTELKEESLPILPLVSSPVAAPPFPTVTDADPVNAIEELEETTPPAPPPPE
jgi:hypothetical protein